MHLNANEFAFDPISGRHCIETYKQVLYMHTQNVCFKNPDFEAKSVGLVWDNDT